jgi:DUF4097 and DUF4098 domain-containing protein YvlB
MSKEKMKMTKRLILMAMFSLGVLLVVPPHVPAQEQLREEFHKTYPLSQSGRVALENIQGNVEIQVWDRNEVKVDAVKTAYTRELLNDAEIVIEASGDSLRIHTQYPDSSLTFNSEGSRRYQNPATVEYTLTVPRTARLNSIELVNGNLLIDGASGEVNASSVNGHVTGRNLKGEVKMATVNGPVEATFDRLDESKAVSLGSVNGSVILIIPSDSNVIIKAGTVSGAITNDFGLPVRRGDYVGRELYGQLGRGGARIKLGNVNGGINIRHASDGRTLSPATSLITVISKSKVKGEGKSGDSDYDWENDSDNDSENANQDARRAARDAAREAARAQLEAQRAQREAERAQVAAERAAQRAQAQATREAAQATREAKQEATQAARAAQAEGVQAAREAQREAAQAVAEAAREATRAAREEAQTAVRVYDINGSSYRLVERSNVNLDVTGMPRINVKTFDGSISIHGWDKPQVVITLIKRASSDQGLKGIQFNATKNGNQIEITATFDKNFAQQIAPGITSTNASANLEIYVPRNVLLRAASGDGHLALDGTGGEVDLITADGSIDVVDGRGRVLAKTDDGRIRIAKFDGAAEAITDDGRITLEGRFAQLSARTGDGTITLSVPANFNAIVEADVEKFVNESNLTVTEEAGAQKRVRRWKIGKGGAVLTLHTGDGKIILRNTNEP